MPYDEGLAHRIRELLGDDPRVSEKKMFGGIAFFVNGSMAIGIIRDELMVRVGPARHAESLARPYARPMDFTGRAMRGFVQVEPAGFEEDAELSDWLARGVAFAATASAGRAKRASRSELGTPSWATPRPRGSAGRPRTRRSSKAPKS